MERVTNEHGKLVLVGATLETEFTKELFHDVDMGEMRELEGDTQQAMHSSLGSITVLNRMTGFGWRDTETGYRDPDGKFWLASGNFDIRDYEVKTIGDAIELIKANANSCAGL